MPHMPWPPASGCEFQHVKACHCSSPALELQVCKPEAALLGPGELAWDGAAGDAGDHRVKWAADRGLAAGLCTHSKQRVDSPSGAQANRCEAANLVDCTGRGAPQPRV